MKSRGKKRGNDRVVENSIYCHWFKPTVKERFRNSPIPVIHFSGFSEYSG
jgi:hypothetical protein